MKKNLFLIAALVLGATAAVSTNVSAADTATSSDGKGTATLNITAGTFSQVGAPSFSFETKMDNKLVTGTATAKSKEPDQSFKVSDYTGTDSGWTVTAQLGAFNNADVHVRALVIPAGTIAAAVDNKDGKISSAEANLTAGGAASTIASAVKTGAGDTTFSYAEKSATLNFDKNTKVAAAKADLTWTATPTVASGASFN